MGTRKGILLLGLPLACMLFFSGLFAMQAVWLLGFPLLSLDWKLYLLPNALGLALGLLFFAWLQSLQKRRQDFESRIQRQLQKLESAQKQLLQERELAEKLTKEFQIFFNAVEQSASYVVITDAKGSIEYINPAFLRATGYAKEEVLGKNPRLWKSGERARSLYRIMWETLSAGRVWQGELCNRRKDGSLYWVQVGISPIRDETNEITNFIAIYEDITQQKAMREGISLALENARSANEAKSRFISAMSHELKTPLNAVLGFSELLAEELAKEGQLRDYVKHIQKSGHYLLELINDVLSLAHLERRKASGNGGVEKINLSSLLYEVAKMVGPMRKEKGLHFELSLPESACFVRAYPLRLRQVVLNLLSNAIKYNQRGGRVVLKCEALEGSLVRISVQDTGPGLSEEAQKHLFEPFNRLGQEKTQVKGTGLGLVLSRQFVESMGGSLGFVSKPGKGSIFWIDLVAANGTDQKPLGKNRYASTEQGKAGLANAKEEPAAESQPEEQERPLENTRLLLLEDDATSRLFMKAWMEKRGGTVRLSSSLAEAQTALGDWNDALPYDVVVSDLNLPDGSALELLDQLRKNPKTAALPVVILTADAEPLLRQKCLDKGARAFLDKPIDTLEFQKVLAELLTKT